MRYNNKIQSTIDYNNSKFHEWYNNIRLTGHKLI